MSDYKSLIGAEIQFTSNIEEYEDYAEPNMRARIVSIRPDGPYEDVVNAPEAEQVWIFEFDYSEYEDHNLQFESSNWYGNRHQGQDSAAPIYTARETGNYEPVDKLYLPAPTWGGGSQWDRYFTLVGSDKVDLIKRYREEGNGKSYVEWLEEVVLSLMETQ